MKGYISVVVAVVGVLAVVYVADGCNEAACAPRVSLCMLIKCCECDMSDKKNCSCCRACQVCLAKHYTECCSCVGLCPAPDPEDGLYRTSSIENLPDPIPDLFAVLTEEEDTLQRWTTHTYSYNLDSLLFKPGTGYTPEFDALGAGKGENKTDEDKKEDNKLEIPEAAIDKFGGLMGVQNCTVAFFSQCMSIGKCKVSCKSMGAAKYRWFHEYGCCQCIGNTCLDYGLSEPQCLHCPPSVDFDSAKSDVSMEIEDYIIDNTNDVKLEEDSQNLKPLAEAAPDTV